MSTAPFDPATFLDVASHLDDLSPGTTEARIRTACGRAYYSAYLVARKRLSRLNRVAGNEGSQHTWLLNTLRASRNPSVVRLGQRLGTLFARRKHADYELLPPTPFQPGDGADAAARARAWIAEFNSIPDADLRL